MRLEDKELVGPELEREQRLEEQRDAAEHELPQATEEIALGLDQGFEPGRVLDALARLLSHDDVAVSRLGLPQRETRALEFLQTAVTGRGALGELVYAEDRSTLLEQALAVLQQGVTHDSAVGRAALLAHDELVGRVAELRDHLASLAEAQEEAGYVEAAARQIVPEPGDPAEAALDGPERPIEPKPFTLDGPERAAEPKPFTLAAPERPIEPKPPTTLLGPELPPDEPRPSTLDGPEPPVEPKPSTLGTDEP